MIPKTSLFEEAILNAYPEKPTGQLIGNYHLLEPVTAELPDEEEALIYCQHDIEAIVRCRGCDRLAVAGACVNAEGEVEIMDTGKHSEPHTDKCGERFPYTIFAIRKINWV